MLRPLIDSLRRGMAELVSRKIFVCAMVGVPMVVGLVFVTMLDPGLPVPVPVGVVDADGSPMSRQMVRTLQANQMLEVVSTPVDYHEALEEVQSGRSFGFFVIPGGYQREALSGREPALTFYSNMSIFVPGTMALKGFKVSAVSTKGGLVASQLVSLGMTKGEAMTLVQPIAVQDHPVRNPWLNYAIYLNNSFLPAVLVLMIMQVTVFSIGQEIKRGTSREWLATAGGSMPAALVGKLLPQTAVFVCVGLGLLGMLGAAGQMPMNNHAGHMVLALVLLVVASQAFGVLAYEAVPNLRLALIVVSLTGILSFSIDGFSFPVPQMYGAVGIFSYITPMRYYYLIYIDQALNGLPIYWSRVYYIALCLFPLAAMPMLGRLKRRMLNPVYVP